MQPPRRPRKTSVGVVGALLRAVVVVALVAMVGWPERHVPFYRPICANTPQTQVSAVVNPEDVSGADVSYELVPSMVARDASPSVILPSD